MSFGGAFDLGSAVGSIKIVPDLKGIEAFKSALVGAEKQSAISSAAIQANFAKLGKSLQSVGRDLSLKLTAPLVLGAGVAVKAASDLNEAISATRVIFADAADEILRFSQSAAQNLGLSQRAALEAAVQYAGLGKQAGLTGQELAGFSEQLLQNASDMASFFNTDPSDALAAIRSGLIGEIEPLRRYNIFLTETAVQQKALQLGIAAAGDELTDQQKIMARYAIIQEGQGAAAGDFARTSAQMAGSLKIARAEFEDAAAALGQELIPATTAAIKILTAAARAFSELPQPVKALTVVVGALAAAAGPVALIAGNLTVAIVALSAATIAGVPALVALGVTLGAVALVLGGGVALGLLARHIVDSGAAAAATTPQVQTLGDTLAALGDTAEETSLKLMAQAIIADLTSVEQQANDTAAAIKAAQQPDLGMIGKGLEPGQSVAEQAAISMAQQQKATEAATGANVKLIATETQRQRVMTATDQIIKSGSRNRIGLLSEVQDLTREYREGQISPEEWAAAVESTAQVAKGTTDRVGELSDTLDDATRSFGSFADIWAAVANDRMAQPWNSATNAVMGFSEATAEAAENTRKAQEAADAFFADARNQAANTAFQGSPAAQLVGFGEQTPADAQANADALDRVSEARTQVLADNAERRKELERDYADTVEQINRDLGDTLKDLDDQREQNARDLSRSLIDLERSTAQQTRQLEGQRTAAIQQANDQLAGVAQQRAENSAALEKGLADAQEAASKQFADIAERRVEVQADAHERMVEAEKQATEALVDLAERRQEVEQDTAQAMADSREQAADALAELAKREVDIQDTLRESLVGAQQQYNDTLKDLADAQAEVRQNLADQLQDLTQAWHQQGRDLEHQAAEIRADLRASLREMDAEWDAINTKNLRAQQALRGEMQDTLRQNALNAKQLKEDLEHVQGDTTFTEGEKDEAAFRTQRALKALALDRELAERDAARKIADLESERRKQQKQYETERQNAVQQAERDLRDLNKQRMQGEQEYHDRRIELEQDAADRIKDINGQRRDAAKRLADAQVTAQQTANDQLADLADDRVTIEQDAADREHDIRDTAAKQYADIADQSVKIEQDLADKRKDIRQTLNGQLSDLADDELTISQDLATRQQALRDDAARKEQDLATQEQKINQDLLTKLGEIEHDKEILLRNAARERGVILRDAANEAAQIAQDQAQAENDAQRVGLDALREMRQTMMDEDLLTAAQQGTDRGKAFVGGELEGMDSRKDELRAASAELAGEVVAGAGAVLDDIRLAGENIGNALLAGLNAAKAKALEAGRAVAAAAEKGAKKEAEIASPSKVWDALGFNMGASLAAGHLRAATLVEGAARANVRRAADAASSEFKRRRMTDPSWATVAEQARGHQRRGLMMARDGRMADLGGQTIQVTLELDGRVLEEKIIRVGVGGLRASLQRNPMHRRRA